MSPIRVTEVKGGFWDRWDDFFDVPGLWCFFVWALAFGVGVLVGGALL